MTSENKLERMLKKPNKESGEIMGSSLAFGAAICAVGWAFVHGLNYSKGNISSGAYRPIIFNEIFLTATSGFGATISGGRKVGLSFTGGLMVAEAISFGAGYGLGYLLR